jgi:hypothetical protein
MDMSCGELPVRRPDILIIYQRIFLHGAAALGHEQIVRILLDSLCIDMTRSSYLQILIPSEASGVRTLDERGVDMKCLGEKRPAILNAIL